MGFKSTSINILPLRCMEVRSVPPAEEQPYDSQKQRGMMLVKDREESAVIVPFT